jgi:hypothetical protein
VFLLYPILEVLLVKTLRHDIIVDLRRLRDHVLIEFVVLVDPNEVHVRDILDSPHI